MKFTIPYPKNLEGFGLNAIYSGKHWTKRKADSEYWHWLVRGELNRQRIQKKLFEKPVCITFYWNDRFDIDNHAYMGKMIVDALKGVLIVDDTRKHYTEVRHKFHSGKDIIVKITEPQNQ